MKIVYLIGKSSVGKDTIYKKLIHKIKIEPYVLYTTRPIRTGEKDGVDYNFLTNEQMEYKINEEKSTIIESRTYNTVYGPWIYATIKDSQFENESDLLMEGTLESYNAVKKYFEDENKINVVPIYIEVDDGIRLERALKRERQQENPKYEEMCRRFLADSVDFSEDKIIESGITKKFENIDVEECVEKIIKYLNEID